MVAQPTLLARVPDEAHGEEALNEYTQLQKNTQRVLIKRLRARGHLYNPVPFWGAGGRAAAQEPQMLFQNFTGHAYFFHFRVSLPELIISPPKKKKTRVCQSPSTSVGVF